MQKLTTHKGLKVDILDLIYLESKTKGDDCHCRPIHEGIKLHFCTKKPCAPGVYWAKSVNRSGPSYPHLVKVFSFYGSVHVWPLDLPPIGYSRYAIDYTFSGPVIIDYPLINCPTPHLPVDYLDGIGAN